MHVAWPFTTVPEQLPASHDGGVELHTTGPEEVEVGGGTTCEEVPDGVVVLGGGAICVEGGSV